MIIAGEVSGDMHGASLITELNKLDNEIKFYGIGGDKMISAGMQTAYHINSMAFLGFAEVIKHIPFIRKVQNELIKIVKEKNINLVVLIDYPGFNLSIAKKFKKLGLKIVYYISPQIWAWGSGRIKKIKYLIYKMIVVFPFEKKYYSGKGIPVEYVGHPLLDQIENYKFISKEELYLKFNLIQGNDILLILPGSRHHEVEKILPVSIKAAEKVAKEIGMQIVIASSSNIDENVYRNIIKSDDIKLIKGFTYDLLKYSKIGIIKSGTSTLEAALLGLPMIIVYKTNLLTYLIGKNLIKINNIGMANIIAEEIVAPELIQNNLSEENIYSELKKILTEKDAYTKIKNKMTNIKSKLGLPGAAERAAKIIYQSLNEA